MGVVITSCPPSTLHFHFYFKLFSLLPVDEKPGVISKVITDYLLPRSVTQVTGGKSSNTKNVKEAQSREQPVLDLSGRGILRPTITMRWNIAFEELCTGAIQTRFLLKSSVSFALSAKAKTYP